MGDCCEDDLDSSMRAPPSSLPQSTVEAFQSGQAECHSSTFEAFCPSFDKPLTVERANVLPKEELPTGDGRNILNGAALKQMVAVSCDQTQVSIDDHHESSVKVSAPDEVERTTEDLTNGSNIRAQTEEPKHQLIEGESLKIEDLPGPFKPLPQKDISKEGKLANEQVQGWCSENHIHQEGSLSEKSEKFDLNRIISDFQNDKIAHWIKITSPAKSMSPEKSIVDNQNHQRNANETKLLFTAIPNVDVNVGTQGLGREVLSTMAHHDLERNEATELDVSTRNDVAQKLFKRNQSHEEENEARADVLVTNVPMDDVRRTNKMELNNDDDDGDHNDKKKIIGSKLQKEPRDDEVCSDGFIQKSKIWRRELLSSDFSLMYGCLRAVLMKNMARTDRTGLIQTMLATMGEIEEITLGKGIPLPQSVRCETQESKANRDEDEGCEQEPGVAKREAINTIYESPDVPSSDDELMGTQIPALSACKDAHSFRLREKSLNLKRARYLTEEKRDGTVICVICRTNLDPTTKLCRGCSAFAGRIERNYSIGHPLPTCSHKKYATGVKCRSCRYRKYCFLDMTAEHTRLRKVNRKVCPICKRLYYHNRGWKCSKCHNFFLKLIRKKNKIMPTCIHNGEIPNTCEGCRCYNLQVEWPKNEPKWVYPLPLVYTKSNI